MYILWLKVNTVITRWRWLDKQKTTQANLAYFSFIVDQTLVSRPEPWSWNLDSKPFFLPTQFTFIVQVSKSKNLLDFDAWKTESCQPLTSLRNWFSFWIDNKFLAIALNNLNSKIGEIWHNKYYLLNFNTCKRLTAAPRCSPAKHSNRRSIAFWFLNLKQKISVSQSEKEIFRFLDHNTCKKLPFAYQPNTPIDIGM